MKQKPPPNAETVETIDGRVFYSVDGWETVFVIAAGKRRKVTGAEADRARYLAAAQSSAGA